MRINERISSQIKLISAIFVGKNNSCKTYGNIDLASGAYFKNLPRSASFIKWML
jgi:hypothetical protein